LDAGNKEEIPLLSEVLALIKDKIIFIEVKCEGAEEKLIEEIDSKENVIVKAFDHRILKKIKELNPKIKTACLFVGRPVNPLSIINDTNADMISVKFDYTDDDLIEQCHKNNKEVFVWNYDSEEKLKKCKEADYIGTNFPSKISL